MLSSWVFSYNTVEATLLFAGVLVCLCAIMYQAVGVSGVYYQSSKDLITAAVLIIIPVAIAYFFGCVATEIYILWNEAQRTRDLSKARSRKGAKLALDADGEPVIGRVTQAMNPMMLSAQSTTAGAESIAEMADPPPPELWNVFRGSFVDMQAQLKRITEEHVALKQRAGAGGDPLGDGIGYGYGAGGAGASTGSRTKRAFSQVDLSKSGPATAGGGAAGGSYDAGGIAMTSIRSGRTPSNASGGGSPSFAGSPAAPASNPLLRSKSIRRGTSFSGGSALSPSGAPPGSADK